MYFDLAGAGFETGGTDQGLTIFFVPLASSTLHAIDLGHMSFKT